MNAELLKAIAELAWPVLAAIILLALLPTIVKVLRTRGVTIKYGDMELSVQDASDQLRKQIEDIQNQIRNLNSLEVRLNSNAEQTAPPDAEDEEAEPLRRLILWVDDNPTNNAYEIAKIQADGWDISTAESTRAALSLLAEGIAHPDIIVSDMGRREGFGFNRTAGMDLVRGIRAKGLDIPIYVYSSAKMVKEYAQQVREAGANGMTSSPIDLFKFISSGAKY